MGHLIPFGSLCSTCGGALGTTRQPDPNQTNNIFPFPYRVLGFMRHFHHSALFPNWSRINRTIRAVKQNWRRVVTKRLVENRVEQQHGCIDPTLMEFTADGNDVELPNIWRAVCVKEGCERERG